jgi:hypothetical protein
MSSLFTPTNHYLSDNDATNNTSPVDSTFSPFQSDENFTNSTLSTTKTINLLSAVTETQDLKILIYLQRFLFIFKNYYLSSKTMTYLQKL